MDLHTAVKKIRHPYIEVNKKVRGGEPVISGTGIRVLDIAIRYEVMGMSPEDIVIALPHLNLSHVHDALSYYYEHKNEIDTIWKEAIKRTETQKKPTCQFWRKRLAGLKIYTDENVDVRSAEGLKKRGVTFVEMNRLSVGECIKRLSLNADILSPDDMKNQIEFL